MFHTPQAVKKHSNDPTNINLNQEASYTFDPQEWVENANKPSNKNLGNISRNSSIDTGLFEDADDQPTMHPSVTVHIKQGPNSNTYLPSGADPTPPAPLVTLDPCDNQRDIELKQISRTTVDGSVAENGEPANCEKVNGSTIDFADKNYRDPEVPTSPSLQSFRRGTYMADLGNEIQRARLILLAKFGSVAIFAYFGVLARVTLSSGTSQSQSLSRLDSGFLLPNILGCFVMGFMAKMTSLSPRVKESPILAIGITTGFCGSCTTFATWKAKVVKMIAKEHLMTACIYMVVTFCTSQISFLFGQHCAVAFVCIPAWFQGRFLARNEQATSTSNPDTNSLTKLTPGSPEKQVTASGPKTDRSQNEKSPGATNNNGTTSNNKIDNSVANTSQQPPIRPLIRKLASIALCAAGFTILFWTLAFVDPTLRNRLWWIACCFGPFGAMTRFALSLYNPNHPNFPWYTWIANVAASVINICLYIGGDHVSDQLSLLETPEAAAASASYKFWVLAGISTGCMGSLSTVSTWINELNKLADKSLFRSYVYGIATVVAADLLSWAIVGIWMALGHEF